VIRRWRLDKNWKRLRCGLRRYVACRVTLWWRWRRARANAFLGRLARRMPLMHSCSLRAFSQILADGEALRSQAELYRRGRATLSVPPNRQVKLALDTEDFVFTYVGAFRRLRQQVGFAFSPQCERRDDVVVATPFDSGGLVRFFMPRQSPSARLRFLRRHELPVPLYRSLLRQFLAALFADPWDYVRGRDPDHRGPVPLTGGDARRHTWEVRFQNRLPFYAFPSTPSTIRPGASSAPTSPAAPTVPRPWLVAVMAPLDAVHDSLRRYQARPGERNPWETLEEWEEGEHVLVRLYHPERTSLGEVGEQLVTQYVTQEV